MNHICEDDNKICNVVTLKSDGKESHITDKCLACKYAEVNDTFVSNHKNTSKVMDRKSILEELDTQKKRCDV